MKRLLVAKPLRQPLPERMRSIDAERLPGQFRENGTHSLPFSEGQQRIRRDGPARDQLCGQPEHLRAVKALDLTDGDNQLLVGYLLLDGRHPFGRHSRGPADNRFD